MKAGEYGMDALFWLQRAIPVAGFLNELF